MQNSNGVIVQMGTQWGQQAKVDGLEQAATTIPAKCIDLDKRVESIIGTIRKASSDRNLSPQGKRTALAKVVIDWHDKDLASIRETREKATTVATEARERAARGEMYSEATGWTTPKGDGPELREELRAREVRDELRRMRERPNGDMAVLAMYQKAEAGSLLVRAIDEDPMGALVGKPEIEKARNARIDASPIGTHIRSYERIASTLGMALNMARQEVNTALAPYMSGAGDAVQAILSGDVK